jgi:hypothetical protein
MTIVRDVITAGQVTVVPADGATWEDLTAIFGVGDTGRCQCRRFKVMGWIRHYSTLDETDRDAARPIVAALAGFLAGRSGRHQG